jgi:hypothetical protein
MARILRAFALRTERMPVGDTMYAVVQSPVEVSMPRKSRRLVRRSFFVSTPVLRKARRALGARTDAEAVRLSVERVAEMDAFWRLMRKSYGALPPGSFRLP